MITPRNLSDSAKKRIVVYKVEELAAGGDLADIPMFRFPTDGEIVEIGIIGEAAAAGIDGSNTCVVACEVGATAICSKTFNNSVAFPDKGVYTSLGTISNAKRLEGDVLTLSVTNGATANTPVFSVQVEYIPTEVV